MKKDLPSKEMCEAIGVTQEDVEYAAGTGFATTDCKQCCFSDDGAICKYDERKRKCTRAIRTDRTPGYWKIKPEYPSEEMCKDKGVTKDELEFVVEENDYEACSKCLWGSKACGYSHSACRCIFPGRRDKKSGYWRKKKLTVDEAKKKIAELQKFIVDSEYEAKKKIAELQKFIEEEEIKLFQIWEHVNGSMYLVVNSVNDTKLRLLCIKGLMVGNYYHPESETVFNGYREYFTLHGKLSDFI